MTIDFHDAKLGSTRGFRGTGEVSRYREFESGGVYYMYCYQLVRVVFVR